MTRELRTFERQTSRDAAIPRFTQRVATRVSVVIMSLLLQLGHTLHLQGGAGLETAQSVVTLAVGAEDVHSVLPSWTLRRARVRGTGTLAAVLHLATLGTTLHDLLCGLVHPASRAGGQTTVRSEAAFLCAATERAAGGRRHTLGVLLTGERQGGCRARVVRTGFRLTTLALSARATSARHSSRNRFQVGEAREVQWTYRVATIIDTTVFRSSWASQSLKLVLGNHIHRTSWGYSTRNQDAVATVDAFATLVHTTAR